MPGEHLPWVIKYRPKCIDPKPGCIMHVVDQEQAKRLFVPWLKQWLSGKPPEKKAVLFYGPAGCGKTSLVEAAAHEYNLELVEMNASDFRRKEDIERVARVAATQMSLFGRKKIILLDEVDGISGTADKGGLDAVLHLIEVAKHPIVMTANDPWDQKLKPLRDASLMVPFYRLQDRYVVEVLSRICKLEGIHCEPEALELLAKRAEGDLRSAINDLQGIAEGYGEVTVQLVQALATSRDREYNPYEMLDHLFKSKYAWQAKRAVTHANLDYETILQWINENIPVAYDDPEDVWRAHEALARADQYLGRIRKTIDWSLLSYVFDMAGPGVAMARRKSRWKFRYKFQYPEKIKLMAQTKEQRELREAIAAHLAPRLSVSKRRFRSEILPFLQIIFRYNPRYAARLAIGYNLTERMVKYLAGPAASEVLEHMRLLLMRMEKPATATEAATATQASRTTATAKTLPTTSKSTRTTTRTTTTRRSSTSRRRTSKKSSGSGRQRTLF
ncbi:replication factor C large subunit [Pyrolobus fumarii]|uniref:replication factor C large subunit n=1 Tax=Pyrolobus fumarii TaxID=54252 RepID=UPI00064E1564|nr:replication factor C large subunit [Pyrolobus fumarii]